MASRLSKDTSRRVNREQTTRLAIREKLDSLYGGRGLCPRDDH